MQLDRRKFIIGSIAAVSIAGVAGGLIPLCALAGPEGFIRAIDPKLYNLKIGEAAANGVFKDLNKEQIFNRLCGRFSTFDWRLNMSGAVEKASVSDFESSRIVTVNGWVLPETLMHLSALAYLVKANVR